MPNRVIWIDTIDTPTIAGDAMHFTKHSGGEPFHFCMSRSTAIQAAYDVLAAIEAADEPCEVIPILGARPSGYAASA